MLYLEDFLEMTEHLPAELRDRFTEMRELDLTVNNNVDSIEKKCKSVFGQCKRGELDEAAAEAQFDILRKEFHKTYEDAEEKVNIATQVHDLVERYLRRLDGELYKFKCELEADNNGITEILERRSLEMENNSTVSKAFIEALNTKENQEFMSAHINNQNQFSGLSTPTSTKEPRYRTVKSEKRKDIGAVAMTSFPEKKSNVSSFPPNLSSSANTVRSVTPNVNILNSNSSASGLATPIVNTGTANNGVSYNLQQLGTTSASNAIAAAASQAIVATQNMPQGRRTASLKASYEAIHGAGGGPTEFWISRDIANAATAAAQTSLQHGGPNAANMEKKQKKKFQANVSNTLPTQLANNNGVLCTGLPIRSSSSSVSSDSMDMMNTAGLVCVDGVNKNLTLNSLGYGNVNTPYNANVLNASSRETSSSSTTSTMLAVPSSNLTINENGMVVEHTPEGEWTYDPNEPRYCTCNQVSYGDMVACDNDACPYEWFHYPCVGITQPPKGKWFCPKCTVAMRRRGNRKN